MRFLAAHWLLLAPLIFFVAWRYPALGLRRPLRALCALLLMLALLDPALGAGSKPLDVWLLLDRSKSAVSSVQPYMAEWEGLLAKSRGSDDRLMIVDFADTAGLRGEADPAHFAKAPEETRLALAIRYALARMSPERANRLLLIGDGFSTEPLADLAERLAASRVPLDYRLTAADDIADFRIGSLEAPQQVQPNEPFVLELSVAGNLDASVPYRILRDGEPLFSGKLDVISGRAAARFTDRFREAATHQYTAEILPPRDAHPGNNSAKIWLDVLGERHVLFVTRYAGDPVARALTEAGLEVRLVSPGELTLEALSGARAVVINDVPAADIPRPFLRGLDFFVNAQAGGLAMIGGRSSFGAGGYFESPIDPLLPVSMELREEHRKIAVAMALVLDRSGSMAMAMGGGMGNMTKMDLANEGAARTASLLGPRDLLAVFAVDSEPHKVVPLQPAFGNADSISRTVRSITSGGGGIYVYNGISAAWGELASATQQRHIVLFADAADAEQPHEYVKLITEITASKGSVSVIGLGRETDSDAAFLKDVAARGNGRVFFVDNAMDLPAVFAQEAVAVARSTFVEEPPPVVPMAGWAQLAAGEIGWPPAVDGYNLSYLKPQATSAAFSGDGYKAPLVAFWQRGTGRVAAVTFPMAGEGAARVRAWPEHGRFIQTLTRWILQPEAPPGIDLRTRLDGSALEIDLFYDESWRSFLAAETPKLFASEAESGRSWEPAWRRLAPGHFRSSFELSPGEIVRGALKVGDYSLRFGPQAQQYSPEWSFDPARAKELVLLSKQSGGEERLDLANIWKLPRESAELALQRPLTLALLLLFLTEALLNRLNYQLGWPKLGRLPRLTLAPRRARSSSRAEQPLWRPEEEKIQAVEPENPEPAKQESSSADEMRRRFDRAKQGRKNKP